MLTTTSCGNLRADGSDLIASGGWVKKFKSAEVNAIAKACESKRRCGTDSAAMSDGCTRKDCLLHTYMYLTHALSDDTRGQTRLQQCINMYDLVFPLPDLPCKVSKFNVGFSV